MIPMDSRDINASLENVMLARKHRLRAAFRAFSFLVLIVGYAAFNFNASTQSAGLMRGSSGAVAMTRGTTKLNRRRLDDGGDEAEDQDANEEADDADGEEAQDDQVDDANQENDDAAADEMNSYSESSSCEEKKKAGSTWMLVVFVVGVLYMFLALAIVCDEFFVPALEEMSSERHLNLSLDVAGATLMAAGGSAPELFTAFFGTFQESEVGFGTIVGSAVFNVLFVIGMCSLLSKELLQLTWWPLFRDCVYYVIGLAVLAYFVGVHSAGEIDIWEALILLGMYFGYVLVMAFNTRLYKLITGRDLSSTEKDSDGDEYVLDGFKGEDGARAHNDFRWPSNFRAGVVNLLTKPESWEKTAGVGLVLQIKGDVHATFQHVDKDNDGSINLVEFKIAMSDLDVVLSEDEAEHTFEELDTDKSGKISEQEFTKWYLHSEEHIVSSMKQVFDKFDSNKSGHIDREEMQAFLRTIEPSATDADVDDAMTSMNQDQDADISYDEFKDWFMNSILYQKQQQDADADMRGIFANLDLPFGGGILKWLEYIVLFPLILTLAFTIPDVRRPGLGKWCFLAFFLAIAWIGVYSYFMVDWAETIGNTLGIPSIIMGLTFLAAGTSVPDLLSSVIVARRGEGDMAVSSSIGSNIFDILVGLPLPWIAYTAWPTKPNTVQIGSEGVGISIGILVSMILLVIVTIHCNGWKLTKLVGGMMFVFYLLFLVQAVWQELPFAMCS